MSAPRPDWQTLNAYVDGELDSATAGRVAAAAGHDPAVASQIAALYRLKGSAHSAVPAPSGDLMAGVAAPRRRRGAVVLGALAAALLISAGLWLGHATRTGPGLPAAALEPARELHENWLASASALSRDTSATNMLAALSDFGSAPTIPDLAGTGLTVGFVANVRRSGHEILQVGYRGRHGCHLSMFVFHDLQLSEKAVEVAAGRTLAYGWEARDLGYLLFAEGMDRGRFDLIGREVEQATRAGRPLDRKDQTRLAENKRESASCKA